MTAASAALGGRTMSASERAELRRQRILGIVYLAAAAAILVVFALPVGPDVQSKFVLNLAGTPTVPDLILPSAPTLYFLAFLAAFAGVVQLIRGFGAAWAAVLGIVAFCFIFGFLTWVAAEGSMNLTGLLQTTVARSVPIIFGALSGILCERSGVINIAIEGMLLTSAFAAAVVGSITGDVWSGILAAMITGALLGLLLAILAIRYQVDQIIAGFVINILATGLTSYLHQAVLVPNATLNNPPRVSRLDIPVLSDIPVIGPIFFQHNIFIYTAFILVAVIWFALYKTRWGLRVRSVGEHPRAADTVGINVNFIRYRNVMLGGIIAGIGGAYFTIGSTGTFEREMTGGRGYIGLAAMIFGGWDPIGAAGASLVFGFADAIQARAAILKIPVPSELLLALPYIVTIIVVAGLVGRVRAPAADGQPYRKE